MAEQKNKSNWRQRLLAPESERLPFEDPELTGRELAPSAVARAKSDWRQRLSAEEGPAGLKEKAIAAAQGGATGLMRLAPATVGAIRGFRAGMAIPIPPVGPLGVAAKIATVGATTLGGLVVGGLAGEAGVAVTAERMLPGMDEPLIRDIENVKPHLRSYYYGGEIFFSSLAPGAAVVSLAKRGARVAVSEAAGKIKQVAGKLLNDMMEFAAEHPIKFLATEQVLALKSGIGAGIAEEVAPGEAGIRFAAEIGSPLTTAAISVSTRVMYEKLSSVIKQFTRAGRETAAGIALQKHLFKTGGDPESLIKILSDPDVVESTVTAAQKTGFRDIAVLEKGLREQVRLFDVDAGNMADDFFEAIKNAIILLKGTGDPKALVEAARLRNLYLESVIEGRMTEALNEAKRAAKAISRDTPKARSAFSLTAKKIITKAMDDFRFIEGKAWKKVPEDLNVSANRILRRYAKLRGEMLEAEVVPTVVEETIQKLRKATNLLARGRRNGIDSLKDMKALEKEAAGVDGETAQALLEKLGFNSKEMKAMLKRLTTGELIKLRKRMLNLARDAAAEVGRRSGAANDARVYGAVAEAALDDLSAGFENLLGKGVMDAATAGSFDDARALSYAGNSALTRGLVGDALALDNTGSNRLPPVVLLERFMLTGEALGVEQYKELQRAASFLMDMSERNLGTDITPRMMKAAEESFKNMLDIQKRFFQLAARETVGMDGRISEKAVHKFLDGKEEMLEMFPGVEAILRKALTSERGLQDVETIIKGLKTDPTPEMRAISSLLGHDSPADAVAGVLESDTPQKGMEAIIKLAKTGGEDAIRGLRKAIFENAIRNATSPDGKIISLNLLAKELTHPMGGRPGLDSLLRMMMDSGLFKRREAEMIRRLVNRAVEVAEMEGVRATGEPVFGGGVLDIPEMIVDTMYRVVGSRIGTFFAGGQTGPQLIAAGRGSMAVRQMLGVIPKIHLKQIIIDALSGEALPDGKPYSLLTKLLETPDTAAKSIAIIRQIHAYAIVAGYTYATSEGNETPPVSINEEALETESPEPEVSFEGFDPPGPELPPPSPPTEETPSPPQEKVGLISKVKKVFGFGGGEEGEPEREEEAEEAPLTVP